MLKEKEYSDKKRYEGLRSAEFCRRVKEKVKKILEK